MKKAANFRMEEKDKLIFKKLGDGNISEGMRIAAAAVRKIGAVKFRKLREGTWPESK